jgi:prevent-host-death family protein
MDPTWQAAQARHRFSELVDAAMEGESQFIRRRDGRGAVLVSREYFERTKPNLKSYLLDAGDAEEDDAFEAALKDIRSGPPLFPPRDLAAEG